MWQTIIMFMQNHSHLKVTGREDSSVMMQAMEAFLHPHPVIGSCQFDGELFVDRYQPEATDRLKYTHKHTRFASEIILNSSNMV